MKANELMIDDWIYRPDCYDQVKEISNNGIIGLDSLRGRIMFGELKSIPLTAEILEKNGFGYVENDVNPYDGKVLSHFYLGDECFCANMDLHICTYNDGIFWFSSPKLTLNGIRYLHQLQHALRLAGIDKEITI